MDTMLLVCLSVLMLCLIAARSDEEGDDPSWVSYKSCDYTPSSTGKASRRFPKRTEGLVERRGFAHRKRNRRF